MGEFAHRRYTWSPSGKLHLAECTENSQLTGRKGTAFSKIIFIKTLQNKVFFTSQHIYATLGKFKKMTRRVLLICWKGFIMR